MNKNLVFNSIDEFIINKIKEFKNGKYLNFDPNNETDYTAFICTLLNHTEKILSNAVHEKLINEDESKEIYYDIDDMYLLNKNVYQIYKKYESI